MKLIIVLRVFLVVVSVFVELPVFAQPCSDILTPLLVTARAKEVMQDNEIVTSSPAAGNFFCDPLLLKGKPRITTVLVYSQKVNYGDQLIIEPVNKEDWQAKRILKLLEDGC